MIPMRSGVRVWLATGHTDMRKGMQGLTLLVQEHLKRDPHGGDLYVFRGRGGGLVKIVWINIILSGDNAVVIALASRALTEGLTETMTPEEFDALLAESIRAIYDASIT